MDSQFDDGLPTRRSILDSVMGLQLATLMGPQLAAVIGLQLSAVIGLQLAAMLGAQLATPIGVRKMLFDLLALGILHTMFRAAAARASAAICLRDGAALPRNVQIHTVGHDVLHRV